MAETGFISLILALLASIYSIATFAVSGSRQRPSAFLKSARASLLTAFGFMSLAIVILLSALLTYNFKLAYVADYASRDLPIPYLFSALWAGNAGSLLFWGWLLSLFAAIFTLRRNQGIKELVPYASLAMMVVLFFFIIMLITVNPFETLTAIPADGTGLNPMLRNAAMIFHPPLLLAGYVAFTVPFALAISALLSRKLDETWLMESRGWALLAWLMLGIGNLIGAWWAYVELGWGGYWAWDPVENAGLMPWLIGTAFLHSAVVQGRRKTFKTWSMALIIFAFFLTILGTFLTRSESLSSVHTFGQTDTEPWFLGLLFLIFFGSCGLLLYHRKDLKSQSTESIVSKEGAFLINNVLLLAVTLAILFATIFPAIARSAGAARVNIGAPFYNQVSVPIFLCIILLSGVCLLAGWRRIFIKDFLYATAWPMGFAIILAIVLPVVGMKWHSTAAFSISGFVIWATVSRFLRGALPRKVTNAAPPAASRSIWKNKNRYGAYLVHFSVVLIAIGITGSSVYEVEKSFILKPGESMSINQYTLTYNNLDLSESQSKMTVKADLSVYSRNLFLGNLTPEKSLYARFRQPVTEVAIRSTPVEDLYVILVEWDINRTASFRVLVNPLVMWIWIGGGIFLLGGLLCFWPRKTSHSQPVRGKETGKTALE